MAFRNQREAVEWLARECGLATVNELARDKAVRLVAALARVPPTQIAGEVWRRHDKRARVLEAVGRAEREAGGPVPVSHVVSITGRNWESVRQEIVGLVDDGKVTAAKRRGFPYAIMVALRETGHG